MKTLEKKHIETIEEAINSLKTDDFRYQPLIGKLHRLIGYLIARDEIENPDSMPCGDCSTRTGPCRSVGCQYSKIKIQEIHTNYASKTTKRI